MSNEFFNNQQTYKVIVHDLTAGPETKTFSVSLNNVSKRYQLHQQVEIKGSLLNVLMGAVNHKEIVELRNGYPVVVGYQDEPRFAITPVGMPTFPTEPATLITPGVSEAMNKGTVRGENLSDSAPLPEVASAEMAERKNALSLMKKDEVISLAKKEGIEVDVKMTKVEVIDAILAYESTH